jgi:hypothetical protein
MQSWIYRVFLNILCNAVEIFGRGVSVLQPTFDSAGQCILERLEGVTLVISERNQFLDGQAIDNW